MTEMKRFTKIMRLGHRETIGYLREGDYIVVGEKLDGANASLKRGEAETLAFSRNNPLDITNTLRGFYNYAQTISPVLLTPGYVYFGEWLVPHKVDYGAHGGHFYLFDIWDANKERYLPHTEVISEAARIGLAIAPIIYAGPYRDYAHLQSFVGRSFYSKEPTAGEGIVVKNYAYTDAKGTQKLVKMVSEGFREVVKQKAPRDPNAFSVEQQFVRENVTEARVEKALFKLIDEGNAPANPSMSDMGAILKALGSTIVADIIEEEGDQLPADVDTQNITKACGKVVPPVLRGIIERLEMEAV